LNTDSPLNYQWQIDGKDIPAATNVTLTLKNLQLTQNGDYRIIVSNAFGSVTSAVVSLEIRAPGPLDLCALRRGTVAFTLRGGKFVAVGNNGLILTSPDGATWTSRNSGADSFFGVAYGGGLFMAVGAATMTSADGIIWSNQISPEFLYSVAYGGGLFAAVGGDGHNGQ